MNMVRLASTDPVLMRGGLSVSLFFYHERAPILSFLSFEGVQE